MCFALSLSMLPLLVCFYGMSGLLPWWSDQFRCGDQVADKVDLKLHSFLKVAACMWRQGGFRERKYKEHVCYLAKLTVLRHPLGSGRTKGYRVPGLRMTVTRYCQVPRSTLCATSRPRSLRVLGVDHARSLACIDGTTILTKPCFLSASKTYADWGILSLATEGAVTQLRILQRGTRKNGLAPQ